MHMATTRPPAHSNVSGESPYSRNRFHMSAPTLQSLVTQGDGIRLAIFLLVLRFHTT